MGWNDRSYYYRENPRMALGGGFSRFSAVTWIIIINVVVFLLDSVLWNSARGSSFAPVRWGYFSVDTAILGGQVWRWITFQFLHADIWHIFFNMLVLFFFGPMIEGYWGRTGFVIYYLLGGMAGALVFVFFVMVPGLRSEEHTSELQA